MTRKLCEAKESFRDSQSKATLPFNNEALEMSDCIRVMQYRLMISVLENLDHCADALVGCKLCIDDLHSMPAVKTSFDVYLEKGISSHFS